MRLHTHTLTLQHTTTYFESISPTAHAPYCPLSGPAQTSLAPNSLESRQADAKIDKANPLTSTLLPTNRLRDLCRLRLRAPRDLHRPPVRAARHRQPHHARLVLPQVLYHHQLCQVDAFLRRPRRLGRFRFRPAGRRSLRHCLR